MMDRVISSTDQRQFRTGAAMGGGFAIYSSILSNARAYRLIEKLHIIQSDVSTGQQIVRRCGTLYETTT